MEQDDKLDFENLRKRAEAFLKEHPDKGEPDISESDQLKLIHELEVFKIELEMQQEELKHVKERTDVLNKKYNELFDLHNRFILHMLKTNKKSE
jgi:hypothetical protein